MSNYYELQEQSKKMLEAAKAELAQLDRRRATLIDHIHQMEVLVGVRAYPTKKKRGRIKTDELKRDILEILKAAPEQKLAAKKIVEHLIKNRVYPDTRSLRTRVYSSLSKWASEGSFLSREGRGVYQLVAEELDE